MEGFRENLTFRNRPRGGLLLSRYVPLRRTAQHIAHTSAAYKKCPGSFGLLGRSWNMRSRKLPPKGRPFGGSQRESEAQQLAMLVYLPVPLSVTDAFVAGAATFTCNVAFLRPLEVGANVTLTVQNAPAARLVPQLLF